MCRKIIDERGEVNMVAIVLILLVVIALAVIFKESLIELLQGLLDRIRNEALQL
uniref:Flp1 family type IVb pilin n=1 Tax=Ndongobacter massiliensis TaxID=1871025 RepID=UPI0009F80905|nr:Flp1 family type IVb pilin [Ndongobacter massiliensis]